MSFERGKSMLFKKAVKEFIFADERPFDSCHASTLVVLPNGDVLAAWFGGTKEGANDVAIWCSKRTNGSWSYPVKVSDRDGIPHWNPVLFRRDDGRIILYYKEGYKISEWYTMVTYSDDDGNTWSKPVPLVEGDIGGRGPVKNKPIVLKSGVVLAPASIEGKYWDAFVDISYDMGETWTKSEMVPIVHEEAEHGEENSNMRRGIIQPTLWESADNNVHMLLRSDMGYIFRSDSSDGGKTWSPAYATSLPNNNSGIDLVKLKNGTLLLVYNPVSNTISPRKGPRTPLVLSASRDNGVTWEDCIVLDTGPGQFSYPAIVAVDNDVYITYTWHRERIVFWKIEIEEEI